MYVQNDPVAAIERLTDSTGRIPTETAKESRIYPLPHMYIVKDLVADMTLFYKQYRSVKPYLQRTTPSPDVSRHTTFYLFYTYHATGP